MIINLVHGVKVVTEEDQHLEIEVALEMRIEIEIGLVMIGIVEIEMVEIEEVVLVRVVIMEILIGIVIINVDKESPLQKINVGITYNLVNKIYKKFLSIIIAEPRTRPKLQLQPRTKPIDPIIIKEEQQSAAQTAATPASSTNIFGAAKPVDTTAREREIEERLAKSYAESKSKEDGYKKHCLYF